MAVNRVKVTSKVVGRIGVTWEEKVRTAKVEARIEKAVNGAVPRVCPEHIRVHKQ